MKQEKIITPGPPSYSYKSLWRYRQLFYFLVWRDIKVRYKQTIIGILWVVLQPFLTMVVFSFVFGTIGQISSGNIPYPVFVYTGLLLWNLFSRSITSATASVISNQRLIKSVYFPKVIFPLASVAANLVDFAAAFFVLLLLMLYFGMYPQLYGLIFLPVAILVILFIAAGVGVIAASLNALYRDFNFIVPFVLQIGLFLTPVVYSTEMVDSRLRLIIWLNPMAGIIEAVRTSLLANQSIILAPAIISGVLGILIFTVGIEYFRRHEGVIADIV